METTVSTDELISLAREVITVAQERGVPLRALGGVAIEMRAPDRVEALRRSYGDLDLAAPSSRRRDVEQLMREAGLVGEERFNKIQGAARQIWWTDDRRTHIDVFLGEFVMCHRLSFDGRLDVEHPAMPAADLLLMKLQVVELNLKDAIDAAALLSTHQFDGHDAEGAINRDHLTSVLADDWGFYTTVVDNLERLPAIIEDVDPDLGAQVSATCTWASMWRSNRSRRPGGWCQSTRHGARARLVPRSQRGWPRRLGTRCAPRR